MTRRNIPESALQDLYRTLRRHKRKSTLFFVAVVVSTIVLTFLLPKAYRSQGKLFVRLGRENATLDPTATPGQNPIVAVPLSRESEINSVVEIIASRPLLEKVVDALGPAAILGSGQPNESAGATAGGNSESWTGRTGALIGQFLAEVKTCASQFSSTAGLDDRERAILLLAKNVKVEAAKKSSVVEISYEGGTPAQCQAVVAKLIDCYLDEHVRLNRTHGSYQFFADQTRRLRDALAAKETELRDLKNRTGLASPDAQRQLIVARIGRLEDDLLHAEEAQSISQARVRELRQKLASLPETQVAAETSGIGDEGTNRMRDQFFSLQMREKEAQAKYTDDHPKMQAIHQQVATARAVLDAEERSRKQVTKEPDRLHQQAALAILTEEPALASAQAQAEQLRTQLAGVRKELLDLNENEMRVAALQREVALLEVDYRKYANSLEQARIDQQLEVQRMSNIGIVQSASYEPRPIRPRKLLNLFLGICVGVFGGAGAAAAVGTNQRHAADARRRREAPGPAHVGGPPAAEIEATCRGREEGRAAVIRHVSSDGPNAHQEWTAMMLAKLVLAARRLAQRAPNAALRGLLSPQQLARVLARERARSDRTGEVFSLAVFAVGRQKVAGETLAHLAKILRRRLRLTDDAGLLDQWRIGVALPATPASGAWTVVDDVCVCVPAGLPLPECTVYCYPSDWRDGEPADEDAGAEGKITERPARAMEPLFLRRLPIWKRLIDVASASLGLLLLAPLFAVVAAAIKVTSSGPVFFRQRRSGLGGKEFSMVKFRSMVVDAEARKRQLMALNEQDGPAFKIKDDPRTTPIGRFLRRTSIDELPQLWNVWRGDMSLVGPRPLPCEESDACRGWLRQRLDVTPGLTCIWQVRGRSKVSFADWVRMDVQYIRSRSLGRDVKLLLQTVPAVVSRKGAS